MLTKKALITGITGQDGSYLAELLLEKGYEVHGIVRRSSSFNTWRIDHVRERLVLHYGDLVDQNSLARALEALQPDEVYNLAAQSHVKVSFEMPEYTTDVMALGVLRLLDAVRDLKLKTRIYQAGSSEMFGLVQETPQSEKTPFHPRSPYAVSKVCRPLARGQLPRELRACTCRTGSCSTTSRRAAARTSSRARSRWASRRSSRDARRSCGSATWTPSATGATPGTTSRRCGASCSRTSLPTT